MHCCRTWTLGILAAGALALAGSAASDDCDHKAPRQANVDAAGATRVEIEAAAGYLKVVGRPGLTEVRVRGEACASSARLLEDIELTAERRGDRVRIAVDIPTSFWGSSTAALDLDIEVPADLMVEIDDGSGSIEVRGVASADIEDGSGEIRVEDIEGDLRIDDGSGSIDVADVRGEIRIEDGSGEIDIRRAGSVVVVSDGSGGIDIADVAGDVTVRDDGSGDIEVRNVGGDFTVRNDGSGGIRHRNVEGHVSIPAD